MAGCAKLFSQRFLALVSFKGGMCIGHTRMLRLLIYVGDGVIYSLDGGDSLDGAGPFGFGFLGGMSLHFT